ncbi:MAG: trans-4-hydroxy-L-proline dehydratase [Candidatus Poribacteria bacterium]|nr:trans-4-hydroxy-L-proline dehydratase [Candidatus Poribacteria bacterium]
MPKIIDVDETQRMWGTFDEIKEHLYNQFQNIQYDLDTGLSIKDLEDEAVEICYLAVISLAKRFSALALRMAGDYPEYEKRLSIMAKICDRVPAYSPRTFHEALQFIWFMQVMIEIEGESPMSLGHFDRMLYPYYRNDIDSERLTPEQAKELIKFFWYKYHAIMRGRGDSAYFTNLPKYEQDLFIARNTHIV